MLRIGITQRVEVLPERHERRDCLDQAWTPLLEKLGIVPIPIPNQIADANHILSGLQLHGLILSGGNDLASLPDVGVVAPERDALERQLLELAAAKNLPVLGVCRGLQFMAAHYGARLSPLCGHVAKQHAITVEDSATLRLADREAVNSFHRFGLERNQLGPKLQPVASAPDGTVEAIVHPSRRQAAIMWHPERHPSDRQDVELIRAFFGLDTT